MDVSKSYPPISDKDMSNLWVRCSLPLSLQFKVFFEISLHFDKRGREGLRELSKTDSLLVRLRWKVFATLRFNLHEKNPSGIGSERSYPWSTLVLHQCQGWSICHTEILYVKTPSPMYSFFPEAKNEKKLDHEMWYCNKAVGENTIGNFMSTISKAANLETIYKSFH